MCEKWHSACIDTEAQTTVVGLKQAEAYYKFIQWNFTPAQSTNNHWLGSDWQTFFGSTIISIPILSDTLLSKSVDVVETKVSFLLGLNILDKYRKGIASVQNDLRCHELCMEMPLVRMKGHPFSEWGTNNEIQYTYSVLQKLH